MTVTLVQVIRLLHLRHQRATVVLGSARKINGKRNLNGKNMLSLKECVSFLQYPGKKTGARIVLSRTVELQFHSYKKTCIFIVHKIVYGFGLIKLIDEFIL